MGLLSGGIGSGDTPPEVLRMKFCTFYAKDKKTGEEFSFTLNDLYGYEGEDSGVFIKRRNTALSFNSGSEYGGMNPDLEITDIKVTELSESEYEEYCGYSDDVARELFFHLHGRYPTEDERKFYKGNGYYPKNG
jgi:hypothetical protein